MLNQNNIYLYKIIKNTKVLGGGNRFAIWVQGCNKRCQNCIAPDSWSNKDGGYYLSTEELVRLVVDSSNIDGVTISGGEPFLQSEQIFEFLSLLNLEKRRLNYIVYTGYKYDELLHNEKYQKLLSIVDLLIDGEYIDELNNNTPLIGSSNQSVYVLSDDGNKLAYEMQNKTSREVEFVIESKDEIFMVGVPPKDISKITERGNHEW